MWLCKQLAISKREERDLEKWVMGFSGAWCLPFKFSAGDRGLLLLDCVTKAYVCSSVSAT